MPHKADGDKESLQIDLPQIRFLNISFMVCGKNLKGSSTAQIFSWQGKSYEALKQSQNKLHDLGMSTMCWQRHQLAALKASFSGQLFLVPIAGLWSRQIFWKEWKGLNGTAPWDASVGVHAHIHAHQGMGGAHLWKADVSWSFLVVPVLLVPLTNLKSHCRGNGGERE